MMALASRFVTDDIFVFVLSLVRASAPAILKISITLVWTMFRAAAAVPSRILISQVGARVGAGRFLRMGVMVPVLLGVTGVGVAAVVEGLGRVVVVIVGSVVAMLVSFEIIKIKIIYTTSTDSCS